MSTHVTLAFVAHTQRSLFTVHEISVNVNMCFQSLNNMISAIRKIQFGLPKSGNTKVVLRKRFIDMIMWIPNNGLDAI